MAPPDLVYCDQCGGASPAGSVACRFCGAALRLPPPRAADPDAPTRWLPAPDDPWAALVADDGTAPAPDEADAWADPSGMPWGADPEPTAQQEPTGVWAAEPAPTTVQEVPPSVWATEAAPTIDAEADQPRRGLPGWAWVVSVVLLGTALGVGAYVVVDRTDDTSVRTSDPATTTSSSTSTTSTTTTVVTTEPPTTVPVVPATPPPTAPETGPPTIPGAVTEPPTTPAPTEPPTTPAPTTPAPTAAPTTAPPTTPAPTTAPPPGTVPGDLGIPGIPMAQPACDGQYVTILASIKQTTASAMEHALRTEFPGASYLRTDQTCPSLNVGASDGSPLYRIFVGPFPDAPTACAARAQSSQGAFVKRLSDESPQHTVTCPETA